MPKKKKTQDIPPFTIDGLPGMARKLIPFLGTDELYPMLRCMHISSGELVGTNGKIMKVFHVTGIPKCQVTIPGNAVREIADFPDRPVSVQIGHLEATFDDLRTRLMAGFYPDYRTVLNGAADDVSVTMDRQALLKMLMRLRVVADKDGMVKLAARDRGMELFAECGIGLGCGLLKASTEGKESFCFNYALMETVLNSIESDTVTFRSNGSGISPVTIDGENETTIIMPMLERSKDG